MHPELKEHATPAQGCASTIQLPISGIRTPNPHRPDPLAASTRGGSRTRNAPEGATRFKRADFAQFVYPGRSIVAARAQSLLTIPMFELARPERAVRASVAADDRDVE